MLGDVGLSGGSAAGEDLEGSGGGDGSCACVAAWAEEQGAEQVFWGQDLHL